MKVNFQLLNNALNINNQYQFNLTIDNDENNIDFFIRYVEIFHKNVNKSYFVEINKVIRKPGLFWTKSLTRNIIILMKKQILEEQAFKIRVFFNKIIGGKYQADEFYEFPKRFFRINIGKTFQAFISRSVRSEECLIPEYLSSEIKKWGFDIKTVGIPPLKKNYSDNELIQTIKTQIEQSDVIFAIATKRDQLDRLLKWKTTEWIQAETAIGYTLNKSIFVFVDDCVDLKGIAEKFTVFRFNSDSLHAIPEFFDEIMPKIRNIIRKKRNQENIEKFFDGVIVVGGLVVISMIGYQIGKEDGKNC